MLVEFLIDKDDYKKLIKNISFIANNGLKVSKRSLKAEGKENYYFKISCRGKNVKAAEALSEIKDKIESVFKSNNITDYRILLDESSQFFTLELYPLLMEFETKLRKFIHNTLFDISEDSSQRVVAQLRTSLNIDKGNKDIPKFDFLESFTLEKIRQFLFQNNELYLDLKKYTADEKHLYTTKEELIKYIQNNKIDTIWNDLFAKSFDDSILPKIFEKIIKYRNDVMHFHYISFSDFNEGVKLINIGIKDLDKQIKKGIVIENTSQNVEKLSNNIDYQQSVFMGLADIAGLPNLILSPLSSGNVDNLSNIIRTLEQSSCNIPLSSLNSNLLKTASPLYSSIGDMSQLNNLINSCSILSGNLLLDPTLVSDKIKIPPLLSKKGN